MSNNGYQVLKWCRENLIKGKVDGEGPGGLARGSGNSPGLVLQPVTQEMPQVMGKVNIEPLQFFWGHLGDQPPQRHDLGLGGHLEERNRPL